MIEDYYGIIREDKNLRLYQQEAKRSIFSAWEECDNVLFQMPTGTGKTRLFSSIISDIKAWSALRTIDCRILIIAHRIELIDQISENLQRYRVLHGIIAGGRKRDLRQCVQVASIQTITHHTNVDAIGELDIRFIIIDEAHHSVANSYRKLWRLFPDAKKLGVTATPWRMNGAGFLALYDRLITSKPIKEFISDGWLSPYKFYSVKNESIEVKRISSISEFDIEGDYKTSALEKEMDTMQIRARLLDSYLKLAKGKKGIIYSISRNHSDHICEEYKNAGFKIVAIDATTPRDLRRLYVQRFKNGQIDIIVNVDIFSEGFDCPDIEFIQLARPTRSLVKYLQQVGRGLRPTEGKTICIILDNVGSCLRFGLPNKERPWEDYFIGSQEKEKSVSRCCSNERSDNANERDFSEGTDDLYLVEDADGQNNVDIVQSRQKWTQADDTLLETLYVEKGCSIEVISSVFKMDKDEIEYHLSKLGFAKP
ncbi:MAG: DEAD/DEAH box helicase [Bacteroidales bacterium]|nr:DEAD/DEAH box helicase [Bacteroidales bacterium]